MSKIRKGVELAIVSLVGLAVADILAHPLGGRPKRKEADARDTTSADD